MAEATHRKILNMSAGRLLPRQDTRKALPPATLELGRHHLSPEQLDR